MFRQSSKNIRVCFLPVHLTITPTVCCGIAEKRAAALQQKITELTADGGKTLQQEYDAIVDGNGECHPTRV